MNNGTTILAFRLAAAKLNTNFVDDKGFFSGLDKEGKPRYNIWSEVKRETQEINNGVRFNTSEITLLSLCLRFGPTPFLSEIHEEYIWKFVWPKGTPLGGFKSPNAVVKLITEYLNNKENK